jgi:hypothetical protein
MGLKIEKIESTSATETYQVAKDGDWAMIFIQPDRHVLSVVSTLGDFGYAWPSNIGPKDFKTFLSGLSRDYLIEKLCGSSAREFDYETSLKNVKDEILRQRRDGDLTSEEAREFFEDLKGMDPTNTSEGFIHQLDRFDIPERVLSWDFEGVAVTKVSPQVLTFYNEMWKPLMDAIVVAEPKQPKVEEMDLRLN